MTKAHAYHIQYTFGKTTPYMVTTTASRGEARYFTTRAEAIAYVCKIISEVTP